MSSGTPSSTRRSASESTQLVDASEPLPHPPTPHLNRGGPWVGDDEGAADGAAVGAGVGLSVVEILGAMVGRQLWHSTGQNSSRSVLTRQSVKVNRVHIVESGSPWQSGAGVGSEVIGAAVGEEGGSEVTLGCGWVVAAAVDCSISIPMPTDRMYSRVPSFRKKLNPSGYSINQAARLSASVCPPS